MVLDHVWSILTNGGSASIGPPIRQAAGRAGCSLHPAARRGQPGVSENGRIAGLVRVCRCSRAIYASKSAVPRAGSSQALLNRGLRVIGIDPADMDPRVVAHPNFDPEETRAHVRRREFRKVRWLTADMQSRPRDTLDTVEAIVTHREVHVDGLLLTLKLMDGAPAMEVPEYLKRVLSWGYGRSKRASCITIATIFASPR